MADYSGIILDAEKYKKFTGIQKNVGDAVNHHIEDTRILVNENIIELTELSKKRLEKKKKEQLQTPDELGEVEFAEEIATRLHESTDFPSLARKAVEKIGIYFDEQGYWWLWNENEKRWKNCDDTAIYNSIDNKLKDATNSIEPKIKSLLKEALERQARKNKPKELDWHWIQFKDKLINFMTNEEMEATKDYWIANPIPWNVGSSDATPTMDKLFKEWLGEGHDINELKDLCAFSLPRYYFISSVPFLYGNGGDGKTQFMGILSKFVGKNNSCSTTMHYLEKSQFGTWQLMNMLVCELNEIPKNEINEFTITKRISGRDDVPVEKKGYDQRKEKLYAKIFMIGNDVPHTKEQNDGFFRRILLINFPNQFVENGDIFLTVPDVEYENLAKWCLNRLKELCVSFKLTGKKSLIETKEEYKRESNQVVRFLKEENYKIVNSHESKIMVSELSGNYNKWADANNKPILEPKEFKAKLENLGLTIDIDYVYIGNERTRRLFVYGIKKEIVVQKELTKEITKEQKTLFGDDKNGETN